MIKNRHEYRKSIFVNIEEKIMRKKL